MGLLQAFDQGSKQKTTAPKPKQQTQAATPSQPQGGGLLAAFTGGGSGGAPAVNAPAAPPFMAEALDKYGLPYYGEGLKGFTRKVFAKIFDPSKLVEKPTDEQATMIEQGRSKAGTDIASELNKRTNWDQWIGKWTGIKAKDVAQASAAIGTALQGKDAEGNMTDKLNAGQVIKTGAGILYRGAGQVISGGLEALSLIDKGSRKVQAFNASLEDIGSSSMILPDITQQENLAVKVLGDTEIAHRLGRFIQGWADLNPLMTGYNALRAATSGKSRQQAFTTVKNYTRASNMMYTMYWDEAKKDEYFARVRAGENPDLLMRELENPWVELAGSILGDPSTYMGMGLIGKFGKAKTPVRFFGKTLFNLPWQEVGRIPGFTEILGLKNIGRARLAAAGDEFLKVADANTEKALAALGDAADEVDAFKKLQNAVNSVRKQVREYAGVFDNTASLEQKRKALKGTYGFFAPTAEAKADLMKKTVGTVFQVMAGRFKNSDDILETFKAYRNLTSTDDKVAQKAFMTLKEMYGPLPFSNAGMQTMEFMTRMIDEVNVPQLLSKHGDDIPAFAEEAMGKLHGIVDDMYPSINDMADAVKEVKQLGIQATERQKYLAKSYDDLAKARPQAIWANNVNNAIAGTKVYRGLQSFYSGVLMGMRPAYAFRNLIQNSFQIAVDLGARAGLESFTTGAEVFAKSTVGRALKQDWTATVIEREGAKIKDILGFLPTQALKAVGPGEKGFGFLAVGQDIEKVHSVMITRYVVEKEMERALRFGGIPDASFLPNEMKERLLTHALESYGDVKKTITALRKEMATGFAETWRHLELDPAFKDTLQKANLLDELEYIRKTAPDANSFAEQMDAFTKKIDDLAARTADEPALISDANPMADAVVTVEKAFDEGGRKIMSEEELNQFRALNELRYQLQTSFRDVSQALRGQLTGMLPDVNMAKQFDQEFANAYKVLDDGSSHWRRFADEVYNGVYAQSKKGTPPSELWNKVRTVMLDADKDGKPVLRTISLAEAAPNVDPANLTNKQFDAYLWKWFKEQQSQFWSKYTQDTLVKQTDILERMAVTAGSTLDDVKLKYFNSLDNPQLTRIDDLMKQVQDWESHLDYSSFTKLDMQGKTLGDLNKADILTEFPNWKGGKSHLFNAVNADRAAKGAAPYSTIDQVPFEEAVQTLRARAGKVTGEPQANLIKKAVEVPRSELPEAVSSGFEKLAKELQRELFEGEAGKRIAQKTIEGGAETTTVMRQASTNADWYRDLYKQGMGKPAADKALDKIVMDAGKDKGASVEKLKEVIIERIRYGDPKKGVPPDLYLLQQMGADEKTLQTALDDFNDITRGNFTMEEAIGKTAPADAAPAANQVDELFDPNAPFFDDQGNLVTPSKPMPPYVETTQPTVTRQLYENMKGGMRDVLESFKIKTLEKWGQKTPIDSQLTDEMEQGLSKWAAEMEKRTISNRAAAASIANGTRDFILHDYNKTYADKFAAYFLMYHYWGSRTYARWGERVVDTPGVASMYAKWRSTMERAHSEQPEFYRYNAQIGSLPGMGKGPFFFNLEATLNPLYSLTGVDFNDPRRRVDWMSSALDDMGKFGFNLAMPLQWAEAFNLYRKGEDEAARRWLGRLIPATQDLKSGLNLLKDKTGVDLMPDISILPGAKYGEFDPFINLQGGLDAYEDKRVGRALSAMVMDGTITKEQAYDAMRNRSGDLFDEAVYRAINERAPGQVASYFLGVGFKQRTEGDVMVEEFYNKYYKLLAQRENISPDDYRIQFSNLKDEYPFADTVLLSARGGDDRDSAYAYNVLGRIPPGDSYKILSEIGLDEATINKFYESKGDFSDWSPQDKNRFMAAMLDLGATFALPEGTTRQEWDEVKTNYKDIRDTISEVFGEDIWDKLNTYYDLQDTNNDEATAFKESHPEILDALQLKREMVINDPLVYRYYGSLDTIEAYFDGKQRAYLAEKYGANITQTQNEYYSILDPGAAKKYLRQHPELKKYWDEKAKMQDQFNRAVVDFANNLPDQADGAQLRGDFLPANATQEALAGFAGGNTPTWESLTSGLQPELLQSVADYWMNDTKISKRAKSQLDYEAKQKGFYNADDYLRALGQALQQEAP